MPRRASSAWNAPRSAPSSTGTVPARNSGPGRFRPMCGIVGAIAGRDVVPLLIEGLKRLEYRGYDSAGIAVVGADGQMGRLRTVGKVRALEDELAATPIAGPLGIAHTRWATHGAPSERNAHPHIS